MRWFVLARSAPIAVLGLVVAAAAATAAAPKIDALAPTEALPGAVLDIKGTNFTDIVAACEVTIGGEKAVVLEAKPDLIKVFVPETLKPGQHEVKVKIERETSNAVKLKLLERTAEAMEEARREDLGKHEGLVDGVAPVVEKYLRLDPPAANPSGGGLRAEMRKGELYIVVAGDALYPDGFIIFLSLKLDNRFVASVNASVANKRFAAEFGPFKRRLFAGNYSVEAEFIGDRQPANLRRRFKSAFPDENERAKRNHTLDRQYVRVGSPGDEQEHLRLTRQHYESTVRAALARFQELEDAFAATSRSGFVKGRDGVSETEWESFLTKRSLAGLGGDAFKKKVQELKALKTYLTSQSELDEARWREWLDYKWRAEVFEVARRHAEFRDSWEIARYPDALRDLEEAISVLLRLSQRRSQELYELNKLALHKNDDDLSATEGGAGLVQILSGVVSPARFQNLIAKVESEVGIQRR